MQWSAWRLTRSAAVALALIAALGVSGSADATEGVVETTRVGGHPVRTLAHVDILDQPTAEIGPLTWIEIGGLPEARASGFARRGGLALLPSHWCGRQRFTDDTSHQLTDAPRIKVVYAYPKGAPDRFDQYKDLFQRDVALARSAVAAASRGRKTIRFDMGTNCHGGGARYVDIQTVALSHDAAWYGTDPEAAFTSIRSELRHALRLRGRWNVTAYIDGVSPGHADGIASVPLDETHGRSNDSNRGGQRALVFGDGSADFSTRRSRTFVHETLHMLGAVQDGAPHATGLGHCSDGADIMCYEDGGPKAPNPWPKQTCTGPLRIDCGGDDYFASRPARGSYLARRWNLYNSAFMCTAASCDAPDDDALVTTALSTTLSELTSRLRLAGLTGLGRTRMLRVRFRAPQGGRLRLTIAAGRRKLAVSERRIGRAGRTTFIARLRPPARRRASASRLRIAVRLSFRAHGRSPVTQAASLVVRRP